MQKNAQAQKLKATRRKIKGKGEKKKRMDDTIAEEDEVPTKAENKVSMSKEPTRKEKKSRSNERGSVRGGKMKVSAEKTEKPEKEEPKVDPALQIKAAMTLCNYVTSIKDSSLSTYFDKNLANYSNSLQKSTIDWEKNVAKNRSKDVKLLDHSRIRVTNSENGDYLNASLVTFENSESDFILTEYPLPETTLTFWQMVHGQECDRIIAIFEPNTDEAIDEFHRVPDTPSPAPTSTPTSMTESPASAVKSVKAIAIESQSCRCEPSGTKSFFPLFTESYFNINHWLINTRKIETDERNRNWLATYTVEVVPGGCSNGIMARVFNCSTWPSKKVPDDEKKVLALARTPWKDLLATYEPVKDGTARQVRHKPVIVMCDLGLDRSATVVFTAVIIEAVLAGRKVDCDAIFRRFRDQRAGIFTSSMFFSYSIRAALVYLKIKLRGETGSESLLVAIEEALKKVPFSFKKL